MNTLRAVFIVAVVIAASGCRKQPPDVLLITVDTLRGDAVGAYGSGGATTPTIDGLIASGVYFPNATTPMPRTTPAVASLMSGLYPYRHGSREVGRPIDDVPLLAERLRAAGYYTIAISANSSAGPEQGLARGFDRFVSREDLVERYGDALWRDDLASEVGDIGFAAAVTRQAMAQLAHAPGDQPVFLWVFHFDPHSLYWPPAGTPQPSAEPCRELYRHVLASIAPRAGLARAGKLDQIDGALPSCRALYNAEIEYVDGEIASLIQHLDAHRARPRLSVFTADHGENFGEHGLYFEHGDNVHHAALRVPLAFTGPGIPPGRRGDRVVSLIDVAPTILGLTGLPPLDGADGADLSDWCIESTCSDSPTRFAESANAVSNFNFDRLMTGWIHDRVCVNSMPWTLCRRYANGRRQATALYNHLEDPLLRNDVQASHPEVAMRMEAIFDRWPEETARELSIDDGRYKLSWYPQADGTYHEALFDLHVDSAESVDIRADHPDLSARLGKALDTHYQRMARPSPWHSEATARSLRGLGYLQDET